MYTVKIEQTKDYPKRMKYIAETDSFIEKNCDSLSYVRNVHQPYGWIKESGTPPHNHLDVIVMTNKNYELGDEDKVKIIGVFCRNDGDHKLVGVLTDRDISDISELSDEEKGDMRRLYPREDEGEGWFGLEKSDEIIRAFFAQKKKKKIILVQHTESQHHVNGMIGAWGDWELTDYGRKQAFLIGQWLLQEHCEKEFVMYVSDLKRASQTAEEINKTLHIQPVITPIIREVNAGAGNGQSHEWYRANKADKNIGYDPDYRPFEDAESDRDLWKRLYPFYQELAFGEQEKILIISHGTTLSFLQSMLLGDVFEDIEHRRFIGIGGSISKITIETNGKVILNYINQNVLLAGKLQNYCLD